MSTNSLTMATSFAQNAEETLPAEVWDAIASFIANPNDLLQLALTCSRLRAILQENHLDCCSLIAYIDDTELWRELSVNSTKARRVRRLFVRTSEHTDSDAEYRTLARRKHLRTAPGKKTFCLCTITGDKDHGGKWARLMATALSAMTGLREFHLCTSPCCLASMNKWNALDNLSSTVHDFELRFIGCRVPQHEAWWWERDEVIEAIDALGRLRGGYTRFVLSSTSCLVLHAVAPVFGGQSPNLEVLELRNPNVSDTFSSYPCPSLWYNSWPRLTCLALDGILPCSTPDDMRRFSVLHAGLHSLRIFSAGDFIPAPDQDAFPELEELETDEEDLEFASAMFGPLSNNDYRPIARWTLRVTECMTGGDVMQNMDAICNHAGKAETLEKFTYWKTNTYGAAELPHDSFYLRSIAKWIPTITDLTVPDSLRSSHLSCVDTILRFPELQALATVDEQGIIVNTLGDIIIQHIRSNLILHGQTPYPKLQAVNHWRLIGPDWIDDSRPPPKLYDPDLDEDADESDGESST